MPKYFSKLLGLITVFLFFPAQLLAEDASKLVMVVDTRKLTGIEAWWGGLYNEGHLEFAIITAITVPVIGVILGTLADLVMSHLGIDLKNRALAEH
ncbi:MAG: DVU0150 family protein [Candidatus Korobacteraceae bacterium]|jgi:hypothetical protein